MRQPSKIEGHRRRRLTFGERLRRELKARLTSPQFRETILAARHDRDRFKNIWESQINRVVNDLELEYGLTPTSNIAEIVLPIGSIPGTRT